MRDDYLNLIDGARMPILGLGTWKSKPGEVYSAVREALQAGYRHFDCAAIYQNEKEIGRAFQDATDAAEILREDIWVTSKLWNDSHRPEHVREALERTLSDLRLERLDLYLIHWPVAFKHGVTFPESSDQYLTLDEVPLRETWDALVDLKWEGLIRHVGVSNMGPEWIDHLKDIELPVVNQVECHPHLQQNELLEYCKEHDITMTAYSPLGSTDRENKKDDEPPLMGHPVIEGIAEEIGASTPQVLLAWAMQRGTIVIPKSVTPAHIRSNYAAIQVELTDEHMQKIAELDKGYRYVDGTFFCKGDSPYEVEDIFK